MIQASDEAAVLREYGTPRFGDFAEPTPGDGQIVVQVAAAGVNHVDLAICSGTFFTWATAATERSRQRCRRPSRGRPPRLRRRHGGAVWVEVERTLAAEGHLIEVPDGVDDAVAATLGNAGLAAWLSLQWRARLASGETVLVLGATGTVGQIAVQAAKLLGADATVALDQGGDMEKALREAAGGGIDVIIDLLWERRPTPRCGRPPSARGSCRSARWPAGQSRCRPRPCAAASSPSSDARTSTHDVRASAYRRLGEHASDQRLTVDVERVALRDVEHAWGASAPEPTASSSSSPDRDKERRNDDTHRPPACWGTILRAPASRASSS